MSTHPDTSPVPAPDVPRTGMVRVRGASEHNLRRVDVDVPRDAIVAFTGVSGSGKSSLAFGTIYAEAQRRYLESVAPYARRLIQQGHNPAVEEITGLPPAVALQQRRGAPSSRSTVGTLTTLSNSMRMLFSRAGSYPESAAGSLDSDAFSPNTAAGACPECSGLGTVHDVTESSLVPDPALSIRDGAIAAWPGAWQGKNLRDILSHLGHDVDVPWRELSREERDWILFTEEQPVVEITPQRDRVAKPYKGRFWSARSYVLHTLADSASQQMRERVLQYVVTGPCPACGGSGLRPEALAVTFAGRSIAELNAASLGELAEVVRPTAALEHAGTASRAPSSGERSEAAVTITKDLLARLQVLLDLGLGYLSLDRATPTLSPGEMQRLRIATQLRSGLFGVVYVLDEPSAGLHPADAEPLLAVLEELKASGNSVFVVEHDMAVVRRADWIVDVGPQAGDRGGAVLYSGPVAGLAEVAESATRPFLFPGTSPEGSAGRTPRTAPPAAPRARPRTVPGRAGRRPGRPGRPDGRCGCAGSPATTWWTSTRRSPWGCSPPSPGSPARASPRWSARSWPRRSAGTCTAVRRPPIPRTPPAARRRPGPEWARSRASSTWTGSSAWTSGPSGGPRAPTWRPTRGSSTRSASSTRPPTRRGPAATGPGASRST